MVENCKRIRLGVTKKTGKAKNFENDAAGTHLVLRWCYGSLFCVIDGSKKGKKRKGDDVVDDGLGPPNMKARPAPKITKGRFKGRCEGLVANACI